MTAKKLQGRELIDSLINDVGKENWDYIEELSRKHGADFERLIKAIILSESEQRPRWFRQLEILKGIIYKPGTYGVAQVRSCHPIGNRRSVEILVDDVANNLNNLNAWQKLRENNFYQSPVNQVLRLHNDDPGQEKRVIELYRLLKQEYNL
jgi:hypothetical protein